MTEETSLDALLELARGAAVRAGDLLLSFFEAPAAGVSSKTSPTDLVSDADRASERLLLQMIDRARPTDGVLAEEGSARDSTSGYTWVLDPLDGTINFLFGIPVWSVSIAVQDDEGTAVGVVHDPCRGETFVARRGGGATLNGRPITVSDKTDIATALIGTGFSYEPEARVRQAAMLTHVLPNVRDIRRAGSAALDLASLSCGRLDGFYEAPMEPWDKAAGVLLVREAGGVVDELDPPLPHLSPGVLASGPALHPQLSKLVLEEKRAGSAGRQSKRAGSARTPEQAGGLGRTPEQAGGLGRTPEQTRRLTVMDILHPSITKYLNGLATGDDEPVLLEMEALAEKNGFPIIGRLCGKVLEIMTRSIGARRIFEMGSGYGYSAYWFSRATGSNGEIHLTDMDSENERMALDFLGRAGLDGPIDYHVASAFDAFDETPGEFDIVYCDIDKGDYPEAWERARERVRPGGLYMCDNMLWSGRVTGEVEGDVVEGWTEAIDKANRLIAADAGWRSTIVPIRDGLLVAIKL